MRIEKILLENFRSYEGLQEIDLTKKNDSYITLIRGENMHGKTSLFLAIRWCLYGKATSRMDEDIPICDPTSDTPNNLLNSNAFDDGNYSMRVKVTFEHEGEQYSIERRAKSAETPESDDDFEKGTDLKIGEQPITSPTEIETRINDVLHQSASEFYFFDGEVLSRYEEWIKKGESDAVKEAVETTVGISALQVNKHMKELVETLLTVKKRSLGKQQRNAEMLKKIENSTEEVSKIVKEIEGYKAKNKKEQDRIDEITKSNQDAEAYEKSQQKISDLETAITDNNGELKTGYAEIKKHIRETFWLVASRHVEKERKKTIDRLQTTISSAPHLYQKSKENELCEICNQEIKKKSDAYEHVCNRIDEFDHLEKEVDIEEIQNSFESLREMNRFVDPSAITTLYNSQENINRALFAIKDAEKKIKEEKNKDIQKKTSSKQMEELKELTKSLAERTRLIGDAETSKEKKNGEIAELNKKVAKAKSDPATDKQHRAGEFIHAVFENALTKFTDEARKQINDDASNSLKTLISEPGWDRLRIDENYSVWPIDKNGDPAQSPSAGGQQQLTSALLSGLNNNSVYDAPIIMDTPFGRLDDSNRGKTLNWFKELFKDRNQQVILMVHSGEISEDAISNAGIEWGRVYEIQKNSTYSSTIEEMA